MVVDNSFARWHLVRSIPERRLTGTLTVQFGNTYFNWVCDKGRVLHVDASQRDLSFGRFLLEKQLIAPAVLKTAAEYVDDQKTLGFALVERDLVRSSVLNEWLKQYWSRLARYLFQPTAHIFWSHRHVDVKKSFVSVAAAPSEILLRVDTSVVGLVSSLRFLEEIKEPYHIAHFPADVSGMGTQALRIVRRLKTPMTVSRLLDDAEVDRFTCYRTLFLLWVSGCLRDGRINKRNSVAPASENQAWKRIKSIPPDWLFPLAAGVLIGLLFAPAEHKPPASPPKKTRELKQIIERPAWSTIPENNHTDTEDAEQTEDLL